MGPYFHDVYDHVLRGAEWTESLRDLVTSVLETNLKIQGNRLNVTKMVTSCAAIIGVPTRPGSSPSRRRGHAAL
jgi:magnesium transporter